MKENTPTACFGPGGEVFIARTSVKAAVASWRRRTISAKGVVLASSLLSDFAVECTEHESTCCLFSHLYSCFGFRVSLQNFVPSDNVRSCSWSVDTPARLRPAGTKIESPARLYLSRFAELHLPSTAGYPLFQENLTQISKFLNGSPN